MGVVALTCLVSCLIWRLSRGDGAGGWGYHANMPFKSPDHWKDDKNGNCGGQRQSPININKKSVIYNRSLMPITISAGLTTENVTLKTSATSLYLTFSDTWNISSGTETCLRPVAIHWHWGSLDSQGSEHTIDNKKYSMEGHIVTYNCRLFSNISTAVTSNDGLYVFGVLYEIGGSNSVLEKVLANISDVIANGNTTFPEIAPSFFLPQNLSKYYQYPGSLTTPPCTENVLWTVFSDIQSVSADQLKRFRTLQYGSPEQGNMADNFRPVQSDASIKRDVYSSFNEGRTTSLNSVLSGFAIFAIISLIHISD